MNQFTKEYEKRDEAAVNSNNLLTVIFSNRRKAMKSTSKEPKFYHFSNSYSRKLPKRYDSCQFRANCSRNWVVHADGSHTPTTPIALIRITESP
jgi:hypothetical protein